METVHFYTTKKQMVFVFAIVLSLLCLSMYGVYYFFENDEYGIIGLSELFGSYAPLSYTISISMLYLFLLCTVLLFIAFVILIKRLLYDNAIVATIRDEGVTLPPYGMIEWEDIDEVGIVKIHGQKLVGIHLKDPDNFLRRYSLKKSMVCAINYKICGAHFVINNQINVSLEDALKIIKARMLC